MSTSGKWRYQLRSLSHSTKNLVNFGPLTPQITRLIFTHSKSTVRVLRMLMHWSLGHITLLLGEFQPPKMPPNWTYGARWTQVGLCPKCLVAIYFYSPDGANVDRLKVEIDCGL